MGGRGKRRGAGWSPAHPRLPLCSTVAQTHPDGPSWGWGPLGAAVGTWGPRSLRASLPSSDGRSEGQQTIACDREAVKTPDARPSSWNRGAAGRSAPSAQPAVCRKGPRGVRGVKERRPQLRVHSTLPAGAAEWLRGPEPRSPVCRMGTQQSPRPGAGSRWRVTGRGGVSSQTRQAFLSFFALFAPSPFPSPRLEKCFQPGRWEAFCPELTIFQNARIPFRAGLWKPESLSFTTHGTRH